VAGEKDGGAGGMELCVGDGQCGDVKGLQMWVRVSVDLCFAIFSLALARRGDIGLFSLYYERAMNEKHGH